MEIIDITPELAKEYLATNIHNRNPREYKVDTIVRDMINGAWQFNGDPIRFDVNGNLIDGQHRLYAIIKSGCTIKMLVIYGLPASTQETVDIGAKRTLSDALKLRGEKYHCHIPSITRKIYLWEGGVRGSGLGTGAKNASASNAQILQFFETHSEEIREIAKRVSNYQKTIDLPISAMGLAMHLFNNIDYDDSMMFFERLASDVGHEEGEPILALRRRLQKHRETSNRYERATDFYLIAITIKAWNAYRKGQAIERLQWKAGGAAKEVFPEPL